MAILAPHRLAVLGVFPVLVLLGASLDHVRAGDRSAVEAASGFFSASCLDCHAGEFAEAGLDLTALGHDLSEPETRDTWIRIHDRVRDGEMPPEDYGAPDAESVTSFVETIGDGIRQAQRDDQLARGRVRARRLTNRQLEKTLHDLLSIDIPLATLMPEEPRTDGFTNIARGQSISHFHLDTHLTVVDAALDEALGRAAEDEAGWSRDYTARELARKNPKRRCRDPEMRNGLAVVWSSGLAFYGRISSTKVRDSGWYRITFKASSVKKPDGGGVWCSVRSGQCRSSAPLMTWIGAFEATEEPKTVTYEAWIPAGHMLEIRPADANLDRARFRGGQVGVGEGEPQDVPGVALHEMTVEAIHPGGPMDAVRGHLFGDLAVERDSESGQLRLAESVSPEDLQRQVAEFARRAFRRPVEAADLEPYLGLLRRSIAGGQSKVEALRSCYRALLCSPRFLYFTETPGELDNHAVANRLSYMLWNSMPDEELFRRAEQGRLEDPAALRAEVDRMLESDRGKDFVRDLSAQWLDLMEISANEPNRRLYRNFDLVVERSMLAETHAFLQDLLNEDGSVTELIDSGHTYLNSRLANFYEIEGVSGDRLRKVQLDADAVRGGLLTHGSILKVTANGMNTSPVLRGVWVSERLLGQPIPPPPENVPAIEPDIRGATTIREQLEKHKADPSCAGCHRKIDPPGFALESFDAAGRWRERYLGLDGGRRRRGGEVDSGYELPDGRAFEDLAQFQELILEDPRRIARNVAEKLITYGTGAGITFADRDVIEDIVDRSADQDFGFRSLLYAVVTSPTFLTK
jgi:mono/diheme cytochrome c family protein